MPFVAAPQIVRVNLRALFAGSIVENVFDVDALTAVSAGEVDDITNLVSVWAQTTYFPILPAAIQLQEVTGTDMGEENGLTHTIVPEGVVTGAQRTRQEVRAWPSKERVYRQHSGGCFRCRVRVGIPRPS